jgi:uncharacterized protein YoaH (UPF0181 family)
MCDTKDELTETESDGEIIINGLVDDDTIKEAIKSNDDPDHPDAWTVDEIRELLAWVQRGAEEGWDIYMDNVEDGHSKVVYEGTQAIVLSTGEYNNVLEELEHYEGDHEIDSQAMSIVTQIHHELARERCDRSWSVDYPFVMIKPDGTGDGQRYVEAVINSLCERGLSPGQAWAYYGVEIRGNSRNQWAHRMGYDDHSTVSQAVRKAKQKLGV